MKNIKTSIQTLAVLFVAAVVTAACSSDDDEMSGQTSKPKVYTMTVHATKGGDASTRALSLDGKTLNATWTEGDKVEVWSSDGTTVKYGTLTAQSSGSSTTLTGEMDFPAGLSSDLQLQLKYLSNDYSKQTGTLDYIANHCDYATARVKVTGINGKEITTTAAEFQNQQSIIKFTLKLTNGSTINPKAFTINDGNFNLVLTDIPDATYTANGDGVLYVAFPATGSSATVNLIATTDSRDYHYTKTGVTFSNGKYYAIGVKFDTDLRFATAADYGKVVCDEGHLHQAKTAVPTGCIPVGILGKVTETGHGLILALQNAKMQTWFTIDSWESETGFANTTLKVLPDDDARGGLTSYTKLGETPVSNWAVGQHTDYKSIFANLGSKKTDSHDGTTYDDNVNAYITEGVGGTAINNEEGEGPYWTASEFIGYDDDNYGQHLGFYFASPPESFYWDRYWYGLSKDLPESIRPLLGF
jgi:hypothetical protein